MTAKPAEDDYKRGVDNVREAADISGKYNVTLAIEFSKFFTFANTLTTALTFVRAANHPHVRPMIDTYHFWIGPSKFEDLELLRDGELIHMHFEDTPREPVRELLEQRHRVLPGEGVAPLERIVEAVRKKKYAGALSVELMEPSFQSMTAVNCAAVPNGSASVNDVTVPVKFDPSVIASVRPTGLASLAWNRPDTARIRSMVPIGAIR